MSLLERLVEQSSLTPRQLESLTSYLRVALGEIRLKEAASIASQGKVKGIPTKPLTIGSYYRTVSQARGNIRESLVTTVIAIRLGLLEVEDARRLFELMGPGTGDLSDEEQERFMQVLQALLDRIIL